MLKDLRNLLFCLSLILPSLIFADIYSWQTKDNIPSFGDEPINLPSTTVTPSPTNVFTPTDITPYTAPKKPVVKNSVVLYTTSWCGFCRKARKYFHMRNITYTEYDIETSLRAAKAKKRLDTKYERSGVPLVIINNKAIYGYQPDVYQRTLNF